MQLRLLAYAALSMPLLLAAFVAGIVFERYWVQTSSLQGPPAIPSPAPGQTATASKAEQEPAPQPRELSREEKIAEAMQAIEAAWRVAIDSEHLLAVKIGACYGARFIRRGADLRADVQKTDTIVNPYLGIIRISGMTAVNQPTGKYSCFKSITEALAANRLNSESLEPIDATFTYKISDNEIRLDQINSDPSWFATAVSDNVRLNLQSWNAVATQPIK